MAKSKKGSVVRMISNKERRAIAAQLRASRDYVSCLPKLPLAKNAFDAIEKVLECVHYEGGNVFDHLADLIDVPTTRNVATDKAQCHAPQDFACERCGCWRPVDTGFTHCPECGAEVVDDDQRE